MALQRKIDKLKELANSFGIEKEFVKGFGNLSKTSTWEAALAALGHFLPLGGEASEASEASPVSLESLTPLGGEASEAKSNSISQVGS
ncbi:hypothetical protein [Microcoleus sp. PH2017_09_SFU_O_A]|uniref:hypothetical protein n=1 Tax=Microcoleus sp. PH2017_09_SFU_O_A TaxID=2798820 RepID=UPI001E066D6B|nr:hypothetical protein [Microcoleus sp. PH2017_09_SFU_O_A]MCC3447468.1 hypothetical protein [Microcoleus sp. PH2017_09_SFU_O_A]